MCELFGVSAARKVRLNSLLQEFFSHSMEHPHGWGMAFFYENAVSLEKQPENACKSMYLKQRLRAEIESTQMIAHIRLATRGSLEYENTHPFVKRDQSGRTWTLAHNGTIFESQALNPYVHGQKGQTDSERILLYTVDRINGEEQKKGRPLSQEERFAVIDAVMKEITPENKVNLLLFDGELLYVHTNYRDSLHFLRKKTAVFVSTRPLDKEKWEKVPMNMLLAFESGRCRYTGKPHENEFVDSEEKMRMLFLDYAGL